MKSILISIQPQWVEKILNGDKTIEIRTTCPKKWKDYLNSKSEIKPEPMQVVIYCTKEKSYMDRLVQNHNGFYYTVRELVEFDADDYGLYYDVAGFNGEVLAEFTLNEVERFDIPYPAYSCEVEDNLKHITKGSFLTLNDLHRWLKNKSGYAWHIDDLKIYDEPKELSSFIKPTKKNCKSCFLYKDMCGNVCEQLELHFFKPPQSWCYVEMSNESI